MRKFTILFLLVLALVISACGGQDTAEPEPTEVSAQEPAEAPPTDVPPTEVSPTEEPAATEEPTEETAEVPETASPLDTMEHNPDPTLVDITWEWERRDPNGNNVPEIVVPNPENYTLLFNEDGTFNATLDCNNASGSYKTPTPGNIFMELGPMTMAACEEGSLADDMMNMFGPVQSYRLEDEDNVLVMVWAASGPIDYFRNAEAVVEGEEEVKGIPEDAIQMDLQGLAETYAWQVIPASPIPPGPGGKGFPPHILLTFDGAKPEDVIPNSGPYMYIFPTQAYINLYQASGSSIVADQVAKLEQLIATAEGRTALPESPMPLLPPPSSFMERWVQYLDLNFGVGEGVRYVSDSPFRQDIGAWTNDSTGYYYQGLTTDGTFYVSLFWPVGTESLANTSDEVPEDVKSAAQNPETSAAYQQETKDALNALPSTSWNPDLARLDAMMASLTFPTPEADGEEETPNGDDEEVDLPEPDDGEATGKVTAPDGIYIRTGPGTEYPDVGAAPFDETGTIVGVSEDGEWWVVEVPIKPETPEGQGWVSAQFIDAVNAENVPVVPAPEQQPPLIGKTWQWVSTTDPQGMTAVPNPANYTILFNEDGSASIKADCNQVTASYTADGSSISITMGPSTLAACPPESLDQVFLAGLGNTAIYFFEEGDLYMDMQADGGTMRFSAGTGTTPTPVPPTDSEESEGTQFNLVSLGPVGAEQPIIPGSQITATFTDTEVSGFSGCNDYTAALTPVDDYFTVGPIASTKKACNEPAGVMEQETAYLTALGGTSGYLWAEGLVNGVSRVTAGQVFYILADGTSGVLNYSTTP